MKFHLIICDIPVNRLHLPCDMSADCVGCSVKNGCRCLSYSKVRYSVGETSEQTHSKFADKKSEKLSIF